MCSSPSPLPADRLGAQLFQHFVAGFPCITVARVDRSFVNTVTEAHQAEESFLSFARRTNSGMCLIELISSSIFSAARWRRRARVLSQEARSGGNAGERLAPFEPAVPLT